MRIAIFDLDKTLATGASFTPFLIFAARRLAPWRLALLPVWIGAMLAYRAGLFGRGALKSFGMRLFVPLREAEALAALGEAFAARRVAAPGLNPAVIALLERERAAGARLAIATAAFAFYARGYARHLGIDTVIATGWDGRSIPGGNCYGPRKARRVEEWLAGVVPARADATVLFASDSFADAPLLDRVEEPVFVTAAVEKARTARARGWAVLAPGSRTAPPAG